MKVYYCQQRSTEWYKLRCGKLTASNFHVLLNNSATANSFMIEKALERLKNKCISNRFWSIDIQRGIDLESVACAEYERVTGYKVGHVGFVEHNEFVGSSPDGLVGTDGMIEIKCPNEKHFWEICKSRHVPAQHYTQMQFNMWVCKRLWCDYVVFSSNEAPIVIRVYRDNEYIAMIEKRAIEVNRIIDMYGKKLYYTVQPKALKFKKGSVMSGFRVAEAY